MPDIAIAAIKMKSIYTPSKAAALDNFTIPSKK
jgi:hypothetical protein